MASLGWLSARALTESGMAAATSAISRAVGIYFASAAGVAVILVFSRGLAVFFPGASSHAAKAQVKLKQRDQPYFHARKMAIRRPRLQVK
jgi:hypothetical protein